MSLPGGFRSRLTCTGFQVGQYIGYRPIYYDLRLILRTTSDGHYISVLMLNVLTFAVVSADDPCNDKRYIKIITAVVQYNAMQWNQMRHWDTFKQDNDSTVGGGGGM